MDEEFDSHQIDRIWRHRETAVASFQNFTNVFLISESILLVVVGQMFGKATTGGALQIPLISLGIFLTLLWIYVQGKQKFVINQLQKICQKHIPEYNVTKGSQARAIWRFSSTWLLAYLLPLVFGIIWLVFLYALLISPTPYH